MIKIEAPDWMSPFVDWRTRKLDVLLPIKRGLYWLWFLPLEMILKYNRRDCEFFFPDWQGGRGTKVRPFMGYVVIIEECAAMNIQWWKHLKKDDRA